MEPVQVFLAWSMETKGTDEVIRAVKAALEARSYKCYDWKEQPHPRNIGIEVQEQIRRSDILILEGSTVRPNLAFEVGFARALDVPVVVIKQEGTKELPEDFGAPRYINYPGEGADFARFEDEFGRLLDRLEQGGLSRGHRALRRRLGVLHERMQSVLTQHDADHPLLYLRSGWLDALASEVGNFGPFNIVTDPDYYSRCFAELRQWDEGPIKAIADLTDNTETFWLNDLEHLERMSARVTERIFLIDWKLFFGGEAELSRHIAMWRQQKSSHTSSDYDIYVATIDDAGPTARHPFGELAVGAHLLLLAPDCIGGYKQHSDGGPTGRRMLHIERDRHRFNLALRYYNAIKQRAVRFELDHDFFMLKREWLQKLEIGRWDRRWTRATEQRSPAYFERYDQHIRAWIPAYDQLIQYCAATVASEILRIYQASDTPVSILEIGYGTGSLTASIIPWIHTLCEPFDQLGQDYPVDRYRAIDRASQMRELAVRKVGDELGRVVRLLNKTAWEDVDDGVKHNVIFGSLVMHFLLGPDPTDEALRGFFHECARRLAVGGSLVFADCFAPDTDEGREAAVAAWRSWMVGNGLSEEYADAYLEGNPDMVTAASVPRLEAAAEAHNLYKAREKQVGSTQMFRLLVFQQRV